MVRRSLLVSSIVAGAMLIPAVALACGGLVAPNGAVNLLRTSTLAAYHNGIEHYITAFEFSGLGGARFGSIVPLPGRPTGVKRAGRWTLQRLQQEVAPAVATSASAGAAEIPAGVPAPAQVVLRAKVDSLDITVVRGGAPSVVRWATDEGFELSPDAPEVLDFYAARSRYFMAVAFDAKRAARRGQTAGDSVPVHITIPTGDPWVPLRILALGRRPLETIEADVFLLTDRAPALLPAPIGAGEAAGLPVAAGLFLDRSQPARRSLTRDLASDRGMKWLPRAMWFTYLRLSANARDLGYDLAIDASGRGLPSFRAAGFPTGVVGPARNPLSGPRVQVVTSRVPVEVPVASRTVVDRSGWIAASVVLSLLVIAMLRRRPAPA
jgi:hypothetical protein